MKKRGNKYGAKKTIVDGISFDSKAEATYWNQHKKHKGIKRQVKFVLMKPFRKYGKSFREVSYIADFVFYDDQGKILKVVDVKGMRTQMFNLKAKWLMSEYDMPLYIAKLDYRTGLFVETIA